MVCILQVCTIVRLYHDCITKHHLVELDTDMCITKPSYGGYIAVKEIIIKGVYIFATHNVIMHMLLLL